MTTDLLMLALSGALTIIYAWAASGKAILDTGLPYAAGPRDDGHEVSVLTGRLRRAHNNMIENIAVFALLVLVAHLAGKANDMTALGAQIFFWARLAYLPIYAAGIPWLRTLAYFTSIGGMILIFVQLF